MPDALIDVQAAAGRGLRRSPKGALQGQVRSSEPALLAGLAWVQTIRLLWLPSRGREAGTRPPSPLSPEGWFISR